MRGQRLDGVLPTALEGLQQRRETARNLQQIDALLRDEPDEVLSASTLSEAPRGCSFGSGRHPTKSSRYWLAKSSSGPGPGAYVASKADSLTKPNAGGGGALGLRSGVCCRFQPCECTKPRNEAVEAPASELRQDTEQPRRSSPPLVAYRPPPTSQPDFQTLEQQRRVAEVQAAKLRWKNLGMVTTPNYRWTERRPAAGGALSMNRSTSRDGTGKSAVKAQLRKLYIADRKAQKCQAEGGRAAAAVASGSQVAPGPCVVDMMKLPGRDSVRCKRKGQQIVTAFSG
ncbi:hypothetical protein PF010_g19743 [Phytophthora fragariae]|uniref:Uncharacterized protein n=1 Tax=Phytophthora fragariae TaxID=53985 RepID=A0A6G0KGH7_9STRA|nr:hypothetical protein PF010_g19743 [Phytophthora fragariae]KAE9306552.1 hypothetical protein PF008_g21437 [Phytophthora fragariae]